MIKKYVMATIKIPMELKKDNTIESFSEYIDMNFEKIDKIPEKKNITFDDKYITEKINNFYSFKESESEPEPEPEPEKSIIIKKEEIKKRNKKNRITTFKIRDKLLHRQTSRKYI
jgi:hypothetical protein